jgi:predicted helicase
VYLRLTALLIFISDRRLMRTSKVPLYRYDKNEHRIDNITDWAVEQFCEHYQNVSPKPARTITKEAIFHYVYGVLYDPEYRQKYELNLRRSFPRIPFHADFWLRADWGRKLVELHIGYGSVEPWPLERRDIPMDGGEPVKTGRTKSLLAVLESSRPSAKPAAIAPKAILKADKASGRIMVDSQTTLYGVPEEAWEYQLGNRSSLEWILDQHKERKPKDPVIREKFDTYRFANYKEEVIDLLMRVTRVSVET